MVTCGLPCGVVLRPGIDPVGLEEASLVSFFISRWSLGTKARSCLCRLVYLLNYTWFADNEFTLVIEGIRKALKFVKR